MKKVLLCLSTLTALSSALDVEITDVSCQDDMPVEASLQLDCNGSKRCTFGTTVGVVGSVTYDGLEGTDAAENDAAFLTATLKVDTFGFEYDIAEDMEVPVCNDAFFTSTDADVACPADGEYTFATSYALPELSDSGFQNWAASGWTGVALVTMKDGEGGDLAECEFSFQTYASGSSSKNKMIGAMSTGKAGALFGLIGLILSLLLCCYCGMCKRNGNKKALLDMENGAETKGTESEFVRMSDESAYTEAAVDTPQETARPGWTSV